MTKSQTRPEVAWGMDFAVAEEFRGNGVGGQLMINIMHILNRMPDVKRIEFTVHPDNRQRKKYMSWGFQLGEYIEDCYGPGVPRYIMYMELDKNNSQN